MWLCPLEDGDCTRIVHQRAPGWLSCWSIQLPLRSQSHSSWVWAPCRALYWQLRAWSLPLILSVCLSVCLSVSLSLCPSPTRTVSLSLKNEQTFFKNLKGGAPGWLSRLSIRLQLRLWSCGSWVQAPHQAWQLRVWSLLWILCVCLSLPLPYSYSVSIKNK